MSSVEIQKLENELMELNNKILKLRKEAKPTEIKNYRFKYLQGDVSLLSLFGDKKILFAIHNMGQGCRYCTLWADGLNAFVPHIESTASVVLLSKDTPEIQRQFANARGWRFRMASHGGGEYMQEQSIIPSKDNMPGMVCYFREGERIFKKNSTAFGPGDAFCPQWQVLSLAGLGEDDWTPQYSYWQRPAKMDDGGQNLL
jgi:predicted dithiol-disulfide oxidoreductase (DUF899 family)